MTCIIVTGTPGTGKTTVAKKLSELLGFTYIDVNKVIQEHDLSEGFDKKRDCKVIDTERLNRILKKMFEKHENVIIDSHLSHFLPASVVDLCIITHCSLKTLRSRLESRHYPGDKIDENLEAEIMDVIPGEASENGHVCISVDTENLDLSALEENIKKKLKD